MIFRLKQGFSLVNLAKLFFLGLVGGTLVLGAAFVWYSRDLPDAYSISRDVGFSTQILDRQGETVLFDVYEDENRQFVPLSEVPQDLRNATVAIEDKDFYKHGGFDPLAFLRIMKNFVFERRLIGGSTLTQQLVKNVLLTSERSVSRKIRELVLAIEIERRFSKDEILQMYLNEAPYGGTAWGIAAAAEQYFGKKPQELTLIESVVLAGMPQAPSRYSPYGRNPLAYVARATDVARRMREDGYATEEQEKEVVDNLTTVQFRAERSTIKAPHFVMYVREQLEEMFGDELVVGGGLKVVTSLDWELQEKAETIVAEEIDKVAGPLHITNGASLMMDAETGEILSMVGSRDFFNEEIDGQVNVTLRPRQPGSSIKPVTYAAAFEQGYWPGRVIADTVTEFPSGQPEPKYYIPENYDGKEHGLVHLRQALGSSLNIPAVKLLAQVGVREMLETAYRMGFTTLEPTAENQRRFGLSVTLGGGEVKLIDMVTGYGVFANGGKKVEPVSILKVIDRSGKTLFEHRQVEKKQVMDEGVTFLINSILSDNEARLITFSPRSLLNIAGRNVAVKTGTTNDLRDNWTVGWTKKTVVGVWVGNSDNSQMKQVASGVSGASLIWRRQMMEALSRFGDPAFEPPANVEQVDIDKISGYPAHDGFEVYKEWVIRGSLPTGEDPIHRQETVCPGQADKLATSVMVAQGNVERAEYIYVREEDLLTADNLWQKGIDKWLETVTDSRFHPPTEYCEQAPGVHVEIVSPKDKSRVDGVVEVRVTVISDKKLEWVDLYVDGTKDWRFDQGPYQRELNLADGGHEIRVVARNEGGVESDRIHRFAVNQDYAEPTPTPTSSPTPTPTPKV